MPHLEQHLRLIPSPQRAMMGRPLFTPARDKRGRIKRETNAAIGIADAEGRTRNTFPSGHEELQHSVSLLRHAQDRHRTHFDFALSRDAKPTLAMYHLYLPQHHRLAA